MSQTNGRRRSNQKRLIIAVLVVAGVVGVATVIWLATADIRTSRAISFDAKARAALDRDDTGKAFQQAEFAYALSPSDDRAITLGSLAYLRRQYRTAERYFHEAGDAGGGLAELAKVGQVAAAAETGDDSDFRRAIDEAGSPPTNLKVAMANALISGGELSRTGELLKSEQTDSQNVAYAKSIGLADTDLAAARNVQEEARSGFDRPSFANAAYERFIRELIAVPRNGNRDLSGAFARMAATTDSASKKTVLASALYGLGEYRAAGTLAQAAVRDEPAYRDAWNILAAAQISRQEYGEADRSLKVSLELDDGNASTWYLRSQLAKAQKQDRKADEYLDQAEALGYKK